jgi:hypothetical protein
VEWPRVGGSVAEERDRHSALPIHLCCEPSAGDDRHAAGDDPVRTKHADAEIGNVHGAALTLAVAGLTAIELGHHALEVGTLGDAVAVAAMGRDDLVALLQGGAYTHSDCLLADVAVDNAVDLAGVIVSRCSLFETADGEHLPQHFALRVGR